MRAGDPRKATMFFARRSRLPRPLPPADPDWNPPVAPLMPAPLAPLFPRPGETVRECSGALAACARVSCRHLWSPTSWPRLLSRAARTFAGRWHMRVPGVNYSLAPTCAAPIGGVIWDGWGPPDRPASGSRLDYVPRPPPLGPWAFDIVRPDAVGLPAFRLVSRRRAGLAPPLSACLPGSFPLWESAVERRPWHTRPLARHTSDRESADALPRRLVVERGRIQRARGGMWRKNASSSRLGAPRMSSQAVPGSSIRVEPRRRLIRGRGGGRSTR